MLCVNKTVQNSPQKCRLKNPRKNSGIEQNAIMETTHNVESENLASFPEGVQKSMEIQLKLEQKRKQLEEEQRLEKERKMQQLEEKKKGLL